MPTVAVMLAGRPAQDLAAEQIGALATVRFCETTEALLELVARGGRGRGRGRSPGRLRQQHPANLRSAPPPVSAPAADPALRPHARRAPGTSRDQGGGGRQESRASAGNDVFKLPLYALAIDHL